MIAEVQQYPITWWVGLTVMVITIMWMFAPLCWPWVTKWIKNLRKKS